jgi:hypothetical protein
MGVVGMRKAIAFLVLLFYLLSSALATNTTDSHTLGVVIPPVLFAQVEAMDQSATWSLKGPSRLSLPPGTYRFKVVSNTRWTLRLQGALGMPPIIHGRGKVEVTVTLPDGGTVEVDWGEASAQK